MKKSVDKQTNKKDLKSFSFRFVFNSARSCTSWVVALALDYGLNAGPNHKENRYNSLEITSCRKGEINNFIILSVNLQRITMKSLSDRTKMLRLNNGKICIILFIRLPTRILKKVLIIGQSFIWTQMGLSYQIIRYQHRKAALSITCS